MSGRRADRWFTAPSARHRWGVASRVAAAVLGGYALAALASTVSSLALWCLAGLSRADAVMAGTMASFLVYAIVVMAVFHARSAGRAWAGLAAWALPLAVATMWLRA